MLGLLMQGHRGLAVAGTHGKSTTTAMAAEILVAAGCDPTVICGAAPRDGGDGGRAGNGNTVLVEACEFRRNFLYLRPHDAVILNIEPDHFDCYDSREALESAFARFAALLPADGRLIVHYGDAAAQRVAASAGCRIETFGEAASPLGDALRGVPNERNSQPPRNATEGVSYRRDTGPRIAGAKEVVNNFPASNVSGTLRVPMTRGTRSVPHTICFEPSPNLTPDWLAANIQGQQGQYGFDLVHGGRRLGRIELSVVGRHNVLNALAAAALAASCGVSAEAIIRGLSRFSGLRRRLEPLGTAAGVVFWDDYAHHPTEISTTLQTIREVATGSSGLLPVSTPPGVANGTSTGRTGLQPAKCREGVDSRHLSCSRGPPQPGEITAADLAARTRALGQDVPALHAPVDIQHFLQTQLTPDAGACTHGRWSSSGRAISEGLVMVSWTGFENVVRQGEPLAMHTWFQLGGPAEYFAEPENPDQLIALLKRGQEEGVEVRVLGQGSNVLIRDEGVPGLVLRLTSLEFRPDRDRRPAGHGGRRREPRSPGDNGRSSRPGRNGDARRHPRHRRRGPARQYRHARRRHRTVDRLGHHDYRGRGDRSNAPATTSPSAIAKAASMKR